jgi:8-oxo-dGTP pyrophosphatase MutT (NUDIX family)
MPFSDHIRICNSYDPARALPFLAGNRRLGLVRRDNAEVLRGFPDVFRVAADAVKLMADGDPMAISRTVAAVVDALVGERRLPRRHGEAFDVAVRWGEAAVFRVDRGAVPFFGTRAYGVHVNGYRRNGDDFYLWIGRRAPDKRVAPNKLDNLVAGGIGSGHGALDTLIKEAEEEASIPARLSTTATPAGAVSYRMENQLGIRDDVLFVYDLETPADFVPKCNDGEIAEFTLMPAAAVLERVRDTRDFKFNVNLVILDFAVRHGLLRPDHPEYLEIVTGLHRPID